jgi:uncharacterized protein (DUF1786 family)
MRVTVRRTRPRGAAGVDLRDIDLPAIRRALSAFGLALPELVAVAVQDHGYEPGKGNNAVRFDYLQGLIANGGNLTSAIFTDPPPGMIRMQAVADSVPDAYVMDTGMAAVLGALGDPLVARAVDEGGAILVNVGNMHTFATLIGKRRLHGLFELHTGGITPELVGALIDRLRNGTIDAGSFHRDFDGHGAALDPGYRRLAPFRFAAVTGPNRRMIASLGFHEAAPHGDMMLTGPFGLVEGVLQLLAKRGANSGPGSIAAG